MCRTTATWRGVMQAMAVIAAVAACVPAAAEPIFITSGLTARATATVGSQPQVVDSQSLTVAAPLGTSRLDVSAYAQSGSADRSTQVSARIEINVDWNGADNGGLLLRQSFGGVSHGISGEAFATSLSFGPPLWSYTFQADKDARLLFRYDVNVDESLGGARDGGYTFLFDGVAAHSLLAETNGLLDIALLAGETHTIGVRNIVGGFLVSGDSRFSAGYDGFFQWSIADLPAPATVPEPTTLPLVGLMLAVGAAVRRRQPAR